MLVHAFCRVPSNLSPSWTYPEIKQLHLYDCLRANKAMMAWGVEAGPVKRGPRAAHMRATIKLSQSRSFVTGSCSFLGQEVYGGKPASLLPASLLR